MKLNAYEAARLRAAQHLVAYAEHYSASLTALVVVALCIAFWGGVAVWIGKTIAKPAPRVFTEICIPVARSSNASL
jgi:hypothetical protein